MDARGNVTEQTFGSGVGQLTGYYAYFASTGRPMSIHIPDPATPGAAIQNLSYAYDDPFANLTEQQNVAQGVTETFLYDSLQRLTTSTRTWTTLPTEVVNYAYLCPCQVAAGRLRVFS